MNKKRFYTAPLVKLVPMSLPTILAASDPEEELEIELPGMEEEEME